MIARVFDRLLVLYQQLRAGRPSPCRFVPSCSTYAREAIAIHGAGRGSVLATWRVLRCNPWGGWGYDPVPGTHTEGRPAASSVPHGCPPQ